MNKKTKKNRVNKNKLKKRRWLKFLGAVFFILIILSVFGFSFEKVYAQKAYPGVQLGDTKIGGKTREEAGEILQYLVNQFSKDGFAFTATLNGKTKKEIIYPLIISPDDPDLSRGIINFKTEQTLAECFKIGREGSLIERFKEIWQIFWRDKEIDLIVEIDENELKGLLESKFQSLEKPTKNAQLLITEDDQITVTLEESGIVFNYDKGIDNLKLNLAKFTNEQIKLGLVDESPRIKRANVLVLIPRVQEALGFFPIRLYYQDKEWSVEKDQIKDWLEFKIIEDKAGLGFNYKKAEIFLSEIAKEINAEPKEVKFQISNGKVMEFQVPTDGLSLNLEETCQKIENQIIYENQKEVEIVIDIIKPKTAIEEANNLGIKELIGQGVSNFSGSPINRRHNIKVGSSSLNGLLIKPGEEFSLIKALGKIDASTEYLPELVIKGDRTIPEYGGGLCQIGTTTFRVALNTGLPILERQPHSYRVSYYEPAGMDATIYDPHPDLKFINDTGNYILWQTKIEGNDLIFEFWGTSDGRKIEVAKPKIFNITSPGPTQIIETNELKPDEKKCIEKPHKGADTELTRTVEYPNGEIKKDVWNSHYKAWPEVCLVGKEPEVDSANESDGVQTGNEEDKLGE